MANVVAQVIDSHILMAPPAHRLPSLYLLDSICKNIGAPYTDLWASRIVPIFMESYRVVDQPTKVRMEELLATWRDAGRGGRPLFGDVAQRTIEQSLFGSQAKPLPAAAPNKSQTLANIERLLALGAQDSVNNQSPEVADRLDALRELKDHVQDTELSAEQLADVNKQIDAMTPKEPEPAAPEPAAAVAPPSDLIANLMRAGLLPAASSAPAPAPAPAPVPAKPQQDQAYSDFIMSLDTRLTTMDLSRQPPELELVILEHLPLGCRQCANHYPSDEAGKSALDRHLDWHFAQNRRSKASITRGLSRTWLGSISQWVRDGFDDAAEKAAHSDKNGGDGQQEHQLMEKHTKMTVVVPMDSAVASKPCPICKEKFQSEWSEDEEEWIWRNAVEIDGTYYHASCHYSAKSMSETVTRRTTPPLARDTPQSEQQQQQQSSASAQAAATEQEDALAQHLKRKAENAAETLPGEPPLKRLVGDDPQ
ncbi:hypothetical protein MCUN1_000696 [Malassezia cuniculi]|uniref:CID domain-containing protein n=1 Tax=Malassezia cuniculi TaxID=948313 RepID=A0AAF0ENJ1_9BASI|nr:hypothetical protein MCUN1_000696 [Malassezia cuniculi]